MNDRGIKDEMFFRIFQVYFYLIPPQVNGNKQINGVVKFLSSWDLNPAEGQPVAPALLLFELLILLYSFPFPWNFRMSLEKFPQGLPVYSKFLADIYFSLMFFNILQDHLFLTF